MKKLGEEETKQLIDIFREKYINLHRILLAIDPKEAEAFSRINEYYFQKQEEHKEHHHHHDHHHDPSGHDHSKCIETIVASKFFVPEEKMSPTQKALKEFLSDWNLRDILPNVLHNLAPRFTKIKEHGIKDGLPWDRQAEGFVLNQVLGEGTTQELTKLFQKEIKKESVIDSKQPLLLATPATWREKYPGVELNFLEPQFISNLMTKHYAVSKGYINNDFSQALLKELQYFEYEGRFERIYSSEESQRNDKFLYVNMNEVSSKVKALCDVLRALSALPFELNLKASLYLQIGEQFLISFYQGDDGFHKMHLDSSFEKDKDTGVKLTGLLLIASDSGSTNLKMKMKIVEDSTTAKDEEITLERNNLCIIKSRKVGYELKSIPRGAFIIRYFIKGAPDLAKRTM